MEENQSVFELQVDPIASKNLVDAARWARFIAIFSFVVMGCFLIILIAFQARMTYQISTLFSGLSESEGFGILLGVFILIFAFVTVIMVFLLRGASLIKRGVENRNQQELIDGLKSLKVYFTIYGVLAIISVVIKIFNLIAK